MSDEFSYLYGYVYKKSCFYVAAQNQELAEEDPEHTLIFQFEGSELYEWALEAESVSMAYFEHGTVGVVICSKGKAKIDEAGVLRWETIYKGRGAPSSRRSLLASRIIGKICM